MPKHIVDNLDKTALIKLAKDIGWNPSANPTRSELENMRIMIRFLAPDMVVEEDTDESVHADG